MIVHDRPVRSLQVLRHGGPPGKRTTGDSRSGLQSSLQAARPPPGANQKPEKILPREPGEVKLFKAEGVFA
jgi:hypothetical protein